MIKNMLLCTLAALFTLSVADAKPRTKEAARDEMKAKILAQKHIRNDKIKRMRRALQDQISKEKAKWEDQKQAELRASKDRNATKEAHLAKDVELNEKWSSMKEKKRLEIEQIKQKDKEAKDALKEKFKQQYPEIVASPVPEKAPQ